MKLENRVCVVVGAGQTPGETIGNGALASDDARYITGVCLPVDGGLSARG